MIDIYVARQPIYNSALEVIGYELLFRDTDSSQANISDGTLATSRLIIDSFMSIGVENIVGSQPAFINLTADFFIDEKPIPLNREQVVLEVPLAALKHAAVLHGVQQLAGAGYDISLDDYVYSDETAPMLEFARYVKIDMTGNDRQSLAMQYKQCARHDVQVMVKKVETQEELEWCREIGFDGYQGYFFCRPDNIKGRSAGSDRSVVLNLIARLSDPEAKMEVLADVLSQDVGLSYKLLRYINCASFSFRREIDTLRDALIMIGTEMVKKWAILLLITNYNEERPQELAVVAMIRAHMCEQIAQRLRGANPAQAFTVGLFSTLDAVMATPMIELLDTIALTSQIKFALLDHEGVLGGVLQQVLLYERGVWDELDTTTLSASDYAECYVAAVKWANQTRQLLV